MQIDIPTLYYLTIGTLCVAVAMTLWERKIHPGRSAQLGIWALGYGVLTAGCTVMLYRTSFPGVLGEAATNVVFISGYLILLHGMARLDGDGRPLLSVVPVVLVALAWGTFGTRYAAIFWHFGGSLPITLISLGMAVVLLRSPAIRGLRSRSLAVAIAAIHATFYLGRFTVIPVLASAYGPDMLVFSAKVTMFEAVLYSVAMPMALLALVREEAQVQLLAASQTDHLTGLGNRHALFERGAEILKREGEITLLAFDLDHFKSINDRHGHAVGDEVLKLFASVARTALGPSAVLARIGGEEFAALLPGADAASAHLIAEALCRAFALEAARPGGLAIRATVSIGIAQRQTAATDLPQLLSVADKALYSAKALGRDRVEIAPVARAA